MKKNILILFATVSAISCGAQDLKEKEVPANLKEALTRTYPNAKNAEWEKEDGNFEAEFKINGKEQSVLFDVNGNLLETEIEISETELPTQARDYISKSYKDAKIKEAVKITSSGGKISYEAEVNKKDLLFDSAGNFIKIDEESEEKDED